MVRVDRALVVELLADDSLSFREIARRANCSDWSVRSIAREVDNDDVRSHADSKPLTARDWGIFGAIGVAVVGGIWLLVRWLPPMDGAM